ncbi:MAG: aldo/keto reductase, partial [Hyphomicrobiaceae bacterium]
MARLGLGTVQFGLPYGISNASGQVARAEAAGILDEAAKAGSGLLDTAAAYGTAEEVLADILAADASFRIVTKTLRLAEGLESVIARARLSASRLGRACDTLLVHSAPDLAGRDGERFWRRLQDLKADGLFARIGISAYVADDPLGLAERFRPDVMQVPFSLLDQRLLADGTLAGLDRLGVEVHVRSVFLQGLVFMEPAELPPKLAHAAGRLAQVRAAIDHASSSPLEASLAFALSQPGVDIVLVGVTSRAELAGIVAAAGKAPAELDWRQLAIDDPVVLTPSLW